MGLLLEAVDVGGPWTWRWLLRDEQTGNPLADRRVRLDPGSDDVNRFRDLHRYLIDYAAPDRWTEDGARFVGLAGQWAGQELLGAAVGTAILDAAPVTVRVTAPAALGELLLWPLELAHVDGKPLAAQGDVTFVYDIAPGAPARRKGDVGPTLRVLAVFSQPTETTVLALRRERYALSKLIRRIAARGRAAVELRVAQYGVTRERLAEIADEGDGWDILHLSGHGLGGAFVLEQADGSPDVVPTAELIRLLGPVRRRARLAVVSACESAADTTAETLRLLGLTEQAQALEAAKVKPVSQAPAPGEQAAPPVVGQAAAPGERTAPPVPGLARALVSELDCAVLAMRYPVYDEFAIAFADVFYEHLLSRRQPVDVAAARALAQTAGPPSSMSRPAVSLATPGLFGRAAGLLLPVPQGQPRVDTAGPKMAYFDPPYGPGEPPRFVGRAAAMARATAALAPDSGKTTVLLHGMVGSGKTTCAVELAYRNEDRFGAVACWQAPTRDGEWQGALENLASRLETQLGRYGFAMTGHIGAVPALEAFLPRLRRAMEDSGVLLVLDNLETLLTPDGGWRDPRWEPLMAALASHDGESRLILTSRIIPIDPAARTDSAWYQPDAGRRTLTLPVHALSLQESIALARELPHLRELLHADAGTLREPEPEPGPGPGPDQPSEAARVRLEADRARVLRVLRVVQGHPKLMELADAAAADTAQLDLQLAAAEEAAAGQRLEAFFRDGASALEPGEFLAGLKAWTLTALDALSPEARLMAEFIACLEDGDRQSDIIEATWVNLRGQLGRLDDEPGPEPALGEPPAPASAAPERPAPDRPAPDQPASPGPLLAALAAAALIEAVPLRRPAAPAVTSASEPPSAAAGPSYAGRPVVVSSLAPATYRMHPGVAAAIAAQLGPATREAADAELASFWNVVFDQAQEAAVAALVVRAALAAAPYLLRRGEWGVAAFLLDHAALLDESPGTAQAVLPSLRRIAAATGAPQDVGRLARLLARVDPGEAEPLLRGVVDAAADSGDFRVASIAAAELVYLLRNAGRLAEALTMADQQEEFTERAGLGPWARLGDQARRLQVLAETGKHALVLAETEALRAAMAGLPAGDVGEVSQWSLLEAILDTGRSSARATGDWQHCLDLNAEIAASVRRRGAGLYEVTRFRFNDAGPLIRLGRLAEAGWLLGECQRVFEDQADTPLLARVLTTRADLENALGHRQAAADLARSALRLAYAQPEPRTIASSHHNRASSLGRLGGDPAGQRAHRLAAALIFRLSGTAHELAATVRVLAAELPADDAAPSLPTTVAQVVAIAERSEGVRLAALVAALEPDPQAVADALADILRTAAEPPPEHSEPDIAARLEVRHHRDDLRPDHLDRRHVPHARHRADRGVEAECGQRPQFVDDPLAALGRVEVVVRGLVDRVVVAPDLRAVRTQNVELARLARAREKVARVGVLGDHPQRLLLAAAADHDRRVRPGQRLRRVERALERVVLAAVGLLVAVPHLQADLQGLLQPLEALRDRRERDAEPARLLLVPGRPDAEPRPAVRQHVEGGDDLGQDARLPVDHAGDHGEQLRARGAGGQVAERGVPLEHLLLGRPHDRDLEEVVHHRDVLEPGVVGGPRHRRQLRPEPFRPPRRAEVRNLQADFHSQRPPVVYPLTPAPPAAQPSRTGPPRPRRIKKTVVLCP